MNRLLFLVTVLVFSSASQAQNWSPVTLTDKYNYILDNAPIVTHTVWADSAALTSNDSIFHLNRVMHDTIVTLAGGPNACDTCYGMKNLPQFLMRKMVKMPNGVHSFMDPATFVIDADASIGSSWIFDTVNNITALVVNATVQNILGNPDSVKTILLSSSVTDTIILSKTHGITRFPSGYAQNSAYRLAGIQTRNLGVLVPGMKEIFDFAVGDIFEYYLSAVSPSCMCYGDGRRKYQVISKQANGDTLIYGINGFEKFTSMPMGGPGMPTTTTTAINTTITYIDSADHPANMYRHQLVNISKTGVKDYMGTGQHYWWGWNTNLDIFDHLATYIDSNGVFTKSYGYDPMLPPNAIGSIMLNAGSDTLNPQVAMQDPGETAMCVMKKGLGQTRMIWNQNFEFGYSEELSGYVKGQTQVGTITSDAWFTMSTEDLPIMNVQIYPNPSRDKIWIRIDQHEADIQLTNIHGQVIDSFSIGSAHELNISPLPAGIYMMSISTEKGSAVKKVSIIE